MTDTLHTARTCPFDPPPAPRPISPLRYPDGSTGWLVTDHATARQVLADPRFSARMDLAVSPIRGRQPAAPPGAFAFMDPPDHTRYRKLLTGQFTVRRMRLLEPMIAARIDEVLSGLTSPADLVSGFALPVASGVICDLLGVPYSRHEEFEQQSHDMVDPGLPEPARDAAGGAMYAMLSELVAAKRRAPADDLLSGLLPDLSDDEIVGIGLMLLFAGHETTANMLALGTFALLEHPTQLAALRGTPSLIDGAVEELLRYLSIVQYEVNRAALVDVEVAGQLVRAGESLLISLPLANRDPAKFPSPDTLDVTRSTSGHLAFGHGVHQCLGQQLARIELRLGFTALLTRYPDLRLAIPVADVPLNTNRGIYGVAELPVTW